jgi:hypothetical protein
MRTSMKALLAAATGLALASCATGPYDYAYDDAYPAYYGYGYEPGYYVGPSVDFGPAYYGSDRDGHWHHRGGDWDHGGGNWDHGGPPPSVPAGAGCCGPGTGPDGSVTQRDADRWGAGG